MVFAVEWRKLDAAQIEASFLDHSERHYSCNLLHCSRLKECFFCKECKAHTASVSQDSCVSVSVSFFAVLSFSEYLVETAFEFC